MTIAPRDRAYIGTRNGLGTARVIVEHGSDLNPRNDIVNHSPDGFEWGYFGSGPAQLAFALLCDVLGDADPKYGLAQKLHQQFKSERIALITEDRWRMTAGEIRDWIKAKAPPCFRWADEEAKPAPTVFQNDEPRGYAVKRDGTISLRTASYRREAAMINALVIFGDLNAWQTAHMSDDEIRSHWNALTEGDPGRFEIVAVVCEEAANG